jgi:hypothetical protein
MYSPWNWKVGTAMSKLRNFEGGGWKLEPPHGMPLSEADCRNADCKLNWVWFYLANVQPQALVLRHPVSSNLQWLGDCSSLWNISFFHWLDISDSPERLHSLDFPNQLVCGMEIQCLFCESGNSNIIHSHKNVMLQSVTVITVLATYWSGHTEEAFGFTCHNIWWSCNK